MCVCVCVCTGSCSDCKTDWLCGVILKHGLLLNCEELKHHIWGFHTSRPGKSLNVFIFTFPHLKKKKKKKKKKPSAKTLTGGAQTLCQQKGLHHLLGLLGGRVDVLQGVCHGKLPVPQPVPVGQNVVVLKDLLVISHWVVELDQASVVVLQPAVALSKELLTCQDTNDTCQSGALSFQPISATPHGQSG